MDDITRIISSASAGQPSASEELLPLVYSELRKLAARQLRLRTSGSSIQATDLVHEAFLRLVDVSQQQSWDSRGHFFTAAAEAMRRILVERARKKSRIKHGGKLKRIAMVDCQEADQQSPVDLLALDDALRKFSQEYPVHAQFVNLRYFAGLTLEDAGLAIGISRATASRYWAFSKAWLLAATEGITSSPASHATGEQEECSEPEAP